MKFFKFSAMMILLVLIGIGCQKEKFSPDIKKNFDINPAVEFRGALRDIPEFMSKRIAAYNEAAKSLGVKDFKSRWGEVNIRTRIYSKNNQDDNLIILPIRGKKGENHLLVGAYNSKESGLFIVSEKNILTKENVLGTPIDVGFQNIFTKSTNGGDVAGIEIMPDGEGCWEWNGDDECWCFVEIDCGTVGGGDGGGGGDPDPGPGLNPTWTSSTGILVTGGGGGPVNIDYAAKFNAKIQALKIKYNLGSEMTQWLVDHAAIFLEDDILAFHEERIASIMKLKEELGFDDAVAAYLLANNKIAFILQYNAIGVKIINGVLFVKDTQGIIHVDIDPIDWTNSSDSKFWDQVMLVLHEMSNYNCVNLLAYGYEPIDWSNYFYNFTQPYDRTIKNLEKNGCKVSLNMDIWFGDQIIMDTDPCHLGYGGPNPDDIFWEYCKPTPVGGFGLLMLRFTSPPECSEQIEDYALPDC